MRSCRVIAGHRCKSRQASVLVCVLVCLAVATSLITSSVRNALDQRRAMRTQHQLRQTELLLAAGVQRAAGRLHASDDYTGEIWELPAEVISIIESGRVEIEITSAARPSLRQVKVTAKASTGPHTAIQRSYAFSIDTQ